MSEMINHFLSKYCSPACVTFFFDLRRSSARYLSCPDADLPTYLSDPSGLRPQNLPTYLPTYLRCNGRNGPKTGMVGQNAYHPGSSIPDLAWTVLQAFDMSRFAAKPSKIYRRPTYLPTHTSSRGPPARAPTYLPTYLPRAASGRATYLPTFRKLRGGST